MIDEQQVRQRTVLTRTPFFLPVSVPFTATVNEISRVSTNPALSPGSNNRGDIEILGMTSDLLNVTGLFKIGKRAIWSDARVPFPLLFGKPEGPKPVAWLEQPLTLPQGHTISCDLLNVGGEGAGTMVFVGRLKHEVGQRIVVSEGYAEEDIASIDSGFTGSATDDNRVPSDRIDEDFILYGLHTNLASATVRIKGIGGADWMEDPVPLWAISGRATSVVPTQRLHDPYFIPRGYQLLTEFINNGAESSGQLFLKGTRVRNVN